MNHSRLLLLAAALLALSACQPKSASAPADNSPPVATVNGEPISRDLFEFAVKAATGGKSSSDLTPQQRGIVLDNLIAGRVVAEQAVKDGLDKNGDTPYVLQLTRTNVLDQAMEQRYLKDKKPTEEELRAEYQTQLAQMPKTEYHARHILVKDEATANQIIQQLDKGEKFDTLAKQDSLDASKSNGGDLGWFTPGRMVPAFAGAVVALKPGEYTHRAVQTQYGWHVIQLLDTRETSPPPFDQVRQRLEQAVQAKKFKAYVDELTRGASVQKFLDGGTAAPASAAAPAASGSAAAPAPAPAASGETPPPAPKQN
jgi:peptidyl-prolyl cis-trans isomerase C